MPRRRRQKINADPGTPRLRSTLSTASEPVRSAAWTVEHRVLWRAADLLRALAELVKWPFERIAWIAERKLIWPFQERTAGSGRIAGAAALATVAIGAIALGAITLSGGESGPSQVGAPAPVAAVTEPPQATTDAAPAEPVLRGAPPSFAVDRGVGVAAGADRGVTADPTTAPSSAADQSSEAAAATSSQKPVPAGPAAMKVARRFSNAFVFYEIGEKPARTTAVFEETTTPQLATALGERPPRQPEGIEVPQARVLNLVPGPRHGRTYTISASLLRVGATSELRLEIEKRNGSWVVTDVRG